MKLRKVGIIGTGHVGSHVEMCIRDRLLTDIASLLRIMGQWV